MSECVCPTCETREYILIKSTDGFIVRVCDECGTRWYPNGRSVVPRRARQPEVVELPTDAGLWILWELQHDGSWAVGDTLHLSEVDAARWRDSRSREGVVYSRITPPLPVERDSDAEWLRARASESLVKAEHRERALRIADRLDREKGGA